jgi:hypothetical protein
MRRKHLFEIHEQPWLPVSLRDAVTDTLQFLLNAFNAYDPIVPRLRKAIALSQSRRILDLCSGAGGPWRKLYYRLQGLPICLSDRYPNLDAFHQAKLESGDRITFHVEPIDARNTLAGVSGLRTLFTSFHHFRPQEASAIIADAVRNRQGIGVFEAAGRRLSTILLVLCIPAAALLAVPWMRPFRWSRFFWTYVIPAVPTILAFDGIVSCLRSYSSQELSQLVDELDSAGYFWEIGEERSGLMPITYLIGYPRRPDYAVV